MTALKRTPMVIQPQRYAASKIEKVTTKLGLSGLNKQQATHRVIFDTLPLVVSTEQVTFNFFKNVQTRQFPLSNINQNKLDAGEVMAIESFYLFLMRTSNPATPNDVQQIQSLEEIAEFQRLYHSILNIQIAQKQVTKDIYLGSSRSTFNLESKYMTPVAGATFTAYSQSVFKLKVPFVLQPDIEFVIPITAGAIAALPVAGSWRLGLAIEGLGGIYDPAANL